MNRAECTGCGGISRRDFLERSTAAAVGALLASACGGRIDFGLTDPGAGIVPFSVALADYPALDAVGGMALIPGAPVPLVAVRLDAVSYAVFSLVCPHAGSTVELTGTGFHCPNHGATWDKAGSWTGGQRTSGLRRLDTTVDLVTGTLRVEGAGGNVDLTVSLAAFPALGVVGGLARVDGNSTVPVGVARTGPEVYTAYGLACPHQGATLRVRAGTEWRCPEHGARFAAGGALLQGPARTGLTLLQVTLDPEAGTLRIRGNAAPSRSGDDD